MAIPRKPRVSDADIRRMKRLQEAGWQIVEIVRETGFSKKTVRKILFPPDEPPAPAPVC